MSGVKIERIKPAPEGTNPALEELRKTFEEIRQRAFGIFLERGEANGSELDDWVRAERELFQAPSSDLVEKDQEFLLKMAVPGLEAKDLKVTALPNVLLVEGQAVHRREGKQEGFLFHEFSEKRLRRQVDLPAGIDIEKVRASLDKGVLEITAPKSVLPIRKKVEVEAQADRSPGREEVSQLSRA